MNAATTADRQSDLIKLLALVLQNVRETRKFGHTYVKAEVRRELFGHTGMTAAIGDREVRLTFEGYGRSLGSGGHKYKAHARFSDTRKPVPTKLLGSVTLY